MSLAMMFLKISEAEKENQSNEEVGGNPSFTTEFKEHSG